MKRKDLLKLDALSRLSARELAERGSKRCRAPYKPSVFQFYRSLWHISK